MADFYLVPRGTVYVINCPSIFFCGLLWCWLEDLIFLAQCRYTLQYTYPYAYYMEPGPRKKLFEYQQAQLEAEIENLSWKVERAETYDRGVSRPSQLWPGWGSITFQCHS